MNIIPKLQFIEEPFESKLRVGTDCSGIEAPIQALRQLNIPFTHVFPKQLPYDMFEYITGFAELSTTATLARTNKMFKKLTTKKLETDKKNFFVDKIYNEFHNSRSFSVQPQKHVYNLRSVFAHRSYVMSIDLSYLSEHNLYIVKTFIQELSSTDRSFILMTENQSVCASTVMFLYH